MLEREAHAIGGWLAACERDGPAALACERTGGPPALGAEAQAGLRMAMHAAPPEVGIALANWNWKVVRQFIPARCGIRLSRGACLRYLHRLGFIHKRLKKRLLKADEEQRAAFVAGYATLRAEARARGAQSFFADEAHRPGGTRGRGRPAREVSA